MVDELREPELIDNENAGEAMEHVSGEKLIEKHPQDGIKKSDATNNKEKEATHSPTPMLRSPPPFW